MKIYRVQLRGDPGNFNNDESLGYQYFSDKKKALQKHHESKEPHDWDFSEIEVEISKKGILRVLNTYGSHPDNG